MKQKTREQSNALEMWVSTCRRYSSFKVTHCCAIDIIKKIWEHELPRLRAMVRIPFKLRPQTKPTSKPFNPPTPFRETLTNIKWDSIHSFIAHTTLHHTSVPCYHSFFYVRFSHLNPIIGPWHFKTFFLRFFLSSRYCIFIFLMGLFWSYNMLI